MIPMTPFDFSGDPEVDLAVQIQFEGIALKAYGDAHGVESRGGPDLVQLDGNCTTGGGDFEVAKLILPHNTPLAENVFSWEILSDPHDLVRVWPGQSDSIVFAKPGIYEINLQVVAQVKTGPGGWEGWVLMDGLHQFWSDVTWVHQAYESLEIMHANEFFPSPFVREYTYLIEVRNADVLNWDSPLIELIDYEDASFGGWPTGEESWVEGALNKFNWTFTHMWVVRIADSPNLYPEIVEAPDE